VSHWKNGTYSVVTSTKRAPFSTSRRASRQPTAETTGVVFLLRLRRFERDVERRALLGAEQAVGVVHRAEHRGVLSGR